MKDNVQIICPIHGVVLIKPASLLQGKLCVHCGRMQAKAKMIYDNSKFIKKAIEAHGNKYDYSLAEYKGSNKLIKITCPNHGVFEQIAGGHIGARAHGCRLCDFEKRAYDISEFIDKAQKIHGEKYDYSQSVYSLGHKIVIRCLLHGEFSQRAAAHLQGRGCWSCALDSRKLSWVEQANSKTAILYLLRIFNSEEVFFKIGITFNSVKSRYTGNEILRNYQYEVLATHESSPARVWDWEKSIIETFRHLRHRPKGRFAGETECFSSCDEILAIFPL